jgi:hypothetical protein
VSAAPRARHLEAGRTADDSRPFGLPAELVRELVGYYICEGSLRSEQAEVFRTVLSTACGFRVRAAVVRESPRRRARTAIVCIDAHDAQRFEQIFPGSRRLNESSGRISYRLVGKELRRG